MNREPFRYDVAIVGAGVVGASTARELSRFRLRIAVLERGPDVASGASKANSGIVHAGYDAKPGTLKAKYNLAGNPLFDSLSRELDFPFRRNGSLILGFGAADLPALEELRERGMKNGVPGLELLARVDVLGMEPNIGDGVTHALHAPTGGIVCPYEMTIAFAENAAVNGVDFHFECEASAIERDGNGFRIHTPRGEFAAALLINAAGTRSGEVNNRLGGKPIHIRPRRGEYCLLDRSEGDLARRTLFQLPDEMGKGVLVAPTVDGNILLGPTSVDVDDPDADETTAAGLELLLAKAKKDVRRLPLHNIIASFAGVRAHSLDDDFIIGPSAEVPGLVNAAGIESPGLTSAPAIARAMADMAAALLRPRLRDDFNPVRRAPPRFRRLGDAERARLIAADPDYGRVVCRCEMVTRAEVAAALRSPLGVRDLDAVKRRTRIGMGRCQGGFCAMRLPEIIAEELGLPLTAIRKNGAGSEILVGRNKEST